MSKQDRLESLLRKAKDPACSFEEASAAREMAEKLMNELGERRKSKEKVFLKGFYAKEPVSKPPWVLFDLRIRREELSEWLQQEEGPWINAQVCRSKTTDKWYAEVNQWASKK